MYNRPAFTPFILAVLFAILPAATRVQARDTSGGDKHHISIRHEYASVRAPAGVQ